MPTKIMIDTGAYTQTTQNTDACAVDYTKCRLNLIDKTHVTGT